MTVHKSALVFRWAVDQFQPEVQKSLRRLSLSFCLLFQFVCSSSLICEVSLSVICQHGKSICLLQSQFFVNNDSLFSSSKMIYFLLLYLNVNFSVSLMNFISENLFQFHCLEVHSNTRVSEQLLHYLVLLINFSWIKNIVY